MKQYLLFDLDGTLTDPMVGITSSVQYALEKFGIHVKYLKDLIPFIGPPLDDSFQEFYGLSKEDAGKAVEYYREYFAPKGIFENEVYPGIPEILSRLVEAGFTLIVATSKPAVFAKQILEHFGLSDYFSFVGGSELDGTRKRKAEVIGYILETCEIKPQDAIMIGDRKHDIEGAKLCGLESVGVLYGYGSEEELSKAGADHIIKDVKLLEEYLGKQGENPDNLTWYDRLKGRTGGEGKETKMIRFGMIGTGKIAQKFWQANRYGKDFELTAVYSRTLERAREFGFQKGRLQYFDDLEAFANSDCIDAVYVASPNCCHHDQVMTLLKAGKHVLCEKPMASNLKEAEEMFSEAEKQNLILLEGMRSIYAPSFEKMLPYMESLGKIRRATLQYCQYSSRYDNYKRGIIENAFKPELSNGALMDIGVYVVACMIRLFGAPVSIKASGIKLSNGVDGAGTILMEYPDMIGEAIYSKITDSAMPSQIQGEDASMLVQEIENIKDLRIVRKGVVQSIHFEQSDNILNYETQEFIKMIKTGMGWEKSREITLETMKVLDEARRQLHIVFPADEKSQEKKKQKKTAKEEKSILFIEEADLNQERWFGRKVTVSEAQEITGIDDVRFLDSFEGMVNRLMAREDIGTLYFDCYRYQVEDLPDYNMVKAEEFAKKFPGRPIKNIAPVIAALRMQKDEDEIALVRQAIKITDDALKFVMKNLKPGCTEYQAQADFEYKIFHEGADGTAFPTIAGSGANGTMLHYDTNRDVCEDETLLLMDLGAKFQGYCADITRTYPVNGKYTDRQRQVYDVVLAANRAVAKAAKPGMTLKELDDIAKDVLGEGCVKLGLIEKKEDVGTYYMHGVSHHLGIDVHDVTAAWNDKLRPGAIITDEPGLYIDEWEIGIRIEDDILITEDGCEVLSENLMRDPDQIEAFMQEKEA